MTKLTSTVRREADVTSQWFRSGRVEVVLHPAGFIGFREVGRRSQYKLNLNEAARQAVVQSVNKIRAREKELRAAGQRRGAKHKATREVLAVIIK